MRWLASSMRAWMRSAVSSDGASCRSATRPATIPTATESPAIARPIPVHIRLRPTAECRRLGSLVFAALGAVVESVTPGRFGGARCFPSGRGGFRVARLELALLRARDDAAEVEQDDQTVLDLAHAADVLGVDAGEHLGRLLDLVDRQPQHFGDRVDH